MSLENEDESSAVEASEPLNESEKKPRISYTRDFLLSLSELEICKKLPSGFDQSVLSEFEDNSIQERPRSHGSLSIQGFRRNDYSSSPPTRGDSSNFSRGAYGRWDNRSSGWSDKDGEPQSDLDPDSGRRNYGNQSRRPWQNSEHDGLLGSGSFPRPSGFAGGTSAPKGQPNEHYHLARSNEAYQPPRPFKAVPHARTNTHDSFNDETFGSSEVASQDRAEEERKRRASFELMRKEQQKVLQEKQKSSANKQKSDVFTDLILEETKEEGLLEANSVLSSGIQSVPNDDSGKSSVLLQSSKPRPLVPPGFRTTMLDKSSTTKPISSTDKENPKPGIEEIHLLGKENPTQNGTLDNFQDKNTSRLKDGDHRISGFPEVHEPVDGEVFELLGNKILSNSTQESSTSILGKFFGSTPAIKDGGSSSFLEQKSKPDDSLSPRNVQSSRFAQWFNEEEKKPVDDHLSSNRPNDLLSLIVGGDRPILPTDPIPPDSSHKGFSIITKIPSDPNHLYNKPPQPPPVAAVLTCEDLEQTILLEYTEKATNLPPPVPEWAHENTNPIPVDNHATNHLLSLLQKNTIDDIKPLEKHHAFENPKDEANLGQNLSLEALFGTAFMKELQSAQAPVSAQTGPNMTNYENTPKLDVFDLPEEESLITVNDPANNTPFDISEKLAALNSGFRDERFLRGPYDVLEPRMNQNRRPMFHPMDINPQMRFPDQLNQQFSGNMGAPFHHPDTRVTGFDVPGQHHHPHHPPPQMLPPQMRMQGNFPPPHMLRHPQPSNFMGDREREAAMHGFPFGHGGPGPGPGMPLPGVGDGSKHPEAFQRMIEMELRAQSKQQQQQVRPGGMYELRYR